MWNNLRVLAIVLARGGSKRLPRKNLQEIDGVSLVGHTALFFARARTCGILDYGFVSSDSLEIREEAIAYGMGEFQRPAHLASDEANSLDAWRHAHKKAEELLGLTCDISVLLEPTSPIRTTDDLIKTLEALSPSAGFAATISLTPKRFQPYKAVYPSPRDGLLTTKYTGRVMRGFGLRGALIPPKDHHDMYHLNGCCYAGHRKALLEAGSILVEGCVPVITQHPTVSIDVEEDLDYARYLYGKFNPFREGVPGEVPPPLKALTVTGPG